MKKIMLMRLKMPPAINQVNMTIDKNQAFTLLRLLKKYQPETHEAKMARLMEQAQARKEGTETQSKKPVVIRYGLNPVITLVDQRLPSSWLSPTTLIQSRLSVGLPRFAGSRMFRIAQSRARAVSVCLFTRTWHLAFARSTLTASWKLLVSFVTEG